MAPHTEILPLLSAQENMDHDYERLKNLKESDAPSLSFYQWKKPSLTYGYFVKPEEWLHLDRLHEAGYDLGRRPTGGGILFHTEDLAFSLLIPKSHPKLSDNTLENYHLVNKIVQEAIVATHALQSTLLPTPQVNSSFCMAQPTIYDVMVECKKVGGAAQRRTKHGLLHQGTLCLKSPDLKKLTLFLKNENWAQQMSENSFALDQALSVSKESLIESLKNSFIATFR